VCPLLGPLTVPRPCGPATSSDAQPAHGSRRNLDEGRQALATRSLSCRRPEHAEPGAGVQRARAAGRPRADQAGRHSAGRRRHQVRPPRSRPMHGSTDEASHTSAGAAADMSAVACVSCRAGPTCSKPTFCQCCYSARCMLPQIPAGLPAENPLCRKRYIPCLPQTNHKLPTIPVGRLCWGLSLCIA
jgi:hypothetical protein